MLTITFETENAAFEGDKLREIAKMVRQVAEKIEAGRDSGKIMDVNGNSIGTFDVS